MRPTMLSVLTYLHQHQETKGVVSRSVIDIGLHVGRSASSVSNAITRLTQEGFIENLKRGKRTAKGVYRLTRKGSEYVAQKGLQNPINKAPLKLLPDLFRTPYFLNAGNLHQVAPKEHPLTRLEVLNLGVAGHHDTAMRYIRLLSELPAPLVTVEAHPTFKGRKRFVFHELTDEMERVNLEHLRLIPGASPKTFKQHAEENERKREGYSNYLQFPTFMGSMDVETVYREQVQPFLETDPQYLGCEVFTGEKTNSGYGSVKLGRTYVSAHRIAWEAICGSIDAGDEVHHLCGVRACCSVNHLTPLSRENHRRIHKGESIGVRIPVVGNACKGIEAA